MKKHQFVLAIFIFFLLSCEKNEQPAISTQKKIKGISISAIREGSAPQPAVELRDNFDGSWTGSVAGFQLRFYNFNYELRDHPLGGTLPPENGDPAWPSSIGPEPGVTSNTEYACLKIVNDAVYPDNQWVISNSCIFGGMIYVPGAGTNEYHSQVQQVWTKGQQDFNLWAASIAQCYITVGCNTFTSAPRIPSLPDPIDYLKKDMVSPPSSNVLYLCKFVVVTDNSGSVKFGIIVK
jgi:hypothetical protein